MFASDARKMSNDYHDKDKSCDIFQHIKDVAMRGGTCLEYTIRATELKDMVETLRDHGYIVRIRSFDDNSKSKFNSIFISW